MYLMRGLKKTIAIGFLAFVTTCLAVSTTCRAPSSLSVPITNVTLSNGNSMRGVYMPLGTPAQNISFLPEKYATSGYVTIYSLLTLVESFLNSTFVYNSSAADATCPEDSSNVRCITYKGGLFNPSNSSTFEPRDDVIHAGGSESDTLRTTGVRVWAGDWGTESLVVGDVVLEEYPIGMPGFDVKNVYNSQGLLGLGFNSTLLTALKDAGHISSRSYGYWWGLDGVTQESQMDGAIVFGGYDAAKATGSNLTSDLIRPTEGCPSGMQTTIDNIRLDFPNGTTSSVVYPHSSFVVCIRLDFPVTITMADDPYYSKFLAQTETFNNARSQGINWQGALFEPDSVFQGNMSVMLGVAGGLTVSISNDLLAIPDRYIDSEGAMSADGSATEVLISPHFDDTRGATPLLGKQFLSSSYLFVDYDAMTWTLWQATPTESTELVSVGSDCADETATSTPSERGNISTDDDSSTSTGTIAGAAAGGAAGALLVAGVIFLLRRRRRKHKVPRQDAGAGASEYRHELHNDDVKGFGIAELDDAFIVEATAIPDPQEADSRPWLTESGEGRREIYELPGHHPDRSGSLMHSKPK